MRIPFIEVDSTDIQRMAEEKKMPQIAVHLLIESATQVHNDIVNNNDYEECHFNFKHITQRSYELYLEICDFLDIQPIQTNGQWKFQQSLTKVKYLSILE